MKKTSTLLLTALLMLFANLTFADQYVTPSLTYPASGTGSNVTKITVQVANTFGVDQVVTITLLKVDGNAPTGINPGTPIEITIPSGGSADYTYTFTNANINAASPFEIQLGNTTTPSTNKTLTVSQSNPLPVELISFNALTKGSELTLNWATATEKNSNYFEVEESFNGNEFSALGTVKANGASNTLQTYNFRTKNISDNALVYYRLKMVDMDGTFEYSKVIILSDVAVKNYALNINSTTVNTKLNLNEKVTRVVITDLKGQVIYDNANATGIIKTNYSGLGVVRILTNKNYYQTKTFIQQ